MTADPNQAIPSEISADLRSALLHRVRNVELDQLAAVKTLYLTELAELMELVETTCPQVLQDPG